MGGIRDGNTKTCIAKHSLGNSLLGMMDADTSGISEHSNTKSNNSGSDSDSYDSDVDAARSAEIDER